ncbi:LOW QUALITY PROTEIN: hypothetical protein ACHAXT_007346 [Thalassiosira profunda]
MVKGAIQRKAKPSPGGEGPSLLSGMAPPPPAGPAAAASPAKGSSQWGQTQQPGRQLPPTRGPNDWPPPQQLRPGQQYPPQHQQYSQQHRSFPPGQMQRPPSADMNRPPSQRGPPPPNMPPHMMGAPPPGNSYPPQTQQLQHLQQPQPPVRAPLTDAQRKVLKQLDDLADSVSGRLAESVERETTLSVRTMDLGGKGKDGRRSREKEGNIDVFGSFTTNESNKYDFFDTEPLTKAVIVPPCPSRIPIFPEDFPPNGPKEWPLSWWGIKGPTEQFMDFHERAAKDLGFPIKRKHVPSPPKPKAEPPKPEPRRDNFGTDSRRGAGRDSQRSSYDARRGDAHRDSRRDHHGPSRPYGERGPAGRRDWHPSRDDRLGRNDPGREVGDFRAMERSHPSHVETGQHERAGADQRKRERGSERYPRESSRNEPGRGDSKRHRSDRDRHERPREGKSRRHEGSRRSEGRDEGRERRPRDERADLKHPPDARVLRPHQQSAGRGKETATRSTDTVLPMTVVARGAREATVLANDAIETTRATPRVSKRGTTQATAKESEKGIPEKGIREAKATEATGSSLASGENSRTEGTNTAKATEGQVLAAGLTHLARTPGVLDPKAGANPGTTGPTRLA